MFDSLFILLAIVLYVLATVFTAYGLRSKTNISISANAPSNTSILAAYALAIFAAGFHLAYALDISFIGPLLNFGLSSMLVLVSALVTLLFLLGGIAMPIRRLGILVYPFTIVCLLFSWAWGNQVETTSNASIAFNAHILVSLVAYALLAIASIQALLYVYQERQIKNRTNPAMLVALPPLQTMEQLLFRLVGVGFICLSLTLISGAIFSQEIFGHPFVLKHHTLLAFLGWIVFAIMLFKRIKYGLRGSQAVAWTISGFLLIQLGYFGTKIVSESLAVQ
jgi:ABC-type uncharacterized transport system permease subunit